MHKPTSIEAIRYFWAAQFTGSENGGKVKVGKNTNYQIVGGGVNQHTIEAFHDGQDDGLGQRKINLICFN